VLGTVFFDLFNAGKATSAIDAVLVASAGLVLVAAAVAFLLPRRSAAAVEAH
jgi:hypothetical protein